MLELRIVATTGTSSCGCEPPRHLSRFRESGGSISYKPPDENGRRWKASKSNAPACQGLHRLLELVGERDSGVPSVSAWTGRRSERVSVKDSNAAVTHSQNVFGLHALELAANEPLNFPVCPRDPLALGAEGTLVGAVDLSSAGVRITSSWKSLTLWSKALTASRTFGDANASTRARTSRQSLSIGIWGGSRELPGFSFCRRSVARRETVGVRPGTCHAAWRRPAPSGVPVPRAGGVLRRARAQLRSMLLRLSLKTYPASATTIVPNVPTMATNNVSLIETSLRYRPRRLPPSPGLLRADLLTCAKPA
jgi:hypothetical protein